MAGTPDMARAVEVMAQVFGHDRFRPGQREVIERLLGGQHVLALVPTGGGKSLTYQLAALVRPGLGLVVSPLKALMQDQVQRLTSLGVAAATVQSGTSQAEKRTVWSAIRNGRLDLLYVSPELLLKDGARLLAALAQQRIGLVAVDEAHTVSHWGHDFRDAYRDLGRLRSALPDTPIVALTATADEATRRDIMDVLFGGPVAVVRQSFDRPNLALRVVERAEPERQIGALVAARPGLSGIVYVRTRDQADATAAALARGGHPAMGYHAGLAEAERRSVMDRFVTDAAPLVVATVAFGMGVDRADVRFVIHRDLPGTPEAYYQEIGRAGRDGAPADAILLYAIQDAARRRQMIDASMAPDPFKQLQHRRLDALLAMVEATVCRKQALLRYFDEAVEPCGRCDICLEPPELVDATEPARLVLEAIEAVGQRFGRAHLIDLLRGAETEKIRQFRHDRLTIFGAGKGRDAPGWQALLRQLYGMGLVSIDLERFGALRLGAGAAAVLAGQERVHCDLRNRKATPLQRRTPVAAPIPAADATLFQALRGRRAELARERGWPAYLVFGDRTLQEMARVRPTSLEDLAAIDGVGAKKLHTFGADFLAVLQAWRPPGAE